MKWGVEGRGFCAEESMCKEPMMGEIKHMWGVEGKQCASPEARERQLGAKLWGRVGHSYAGLHTAIKEKLFDVLNMVRFWIFRNLVVMVWWKVWRGIKIRVGKIVRWLLKERDDGNYDDEQKTKVHWALTVEPTLCWVLYRHFRELAWKSWCSVKGSSCFHFSPRPTALNKHNAVLRS